MRAERVFFTRLESPLGPLLLTAGNDGLSGLYPTGHCRTPIVTKSWTHDPGRFDSARAQLEEYFDRRRVVFDLELAPRGTPFQQEVWDHLRAIPYGQTVSYGELARRIGRPTASRAVGAANARNPISIIVPCHRVIGSNGEPTGYAAGVGTKLTLLELEMSRLAAPRSGSPA